MAKFSLFKFFLLIIIRTNVPICGFFPSHCNVVGFTLKSHRHFNVKATAFQRKADAILT